MVAPAARKEFLASKAAGSAPGAKAVQAYAAQVGKLLGNLDRSANALEKALLGKHEGIIKAMTDLREVVDGLEKILPDAAWPLPKYREMLFIY